jgi:AraC family transcriptional regulator, transcriptional activator of pobA
MAWYFLHMPPRIRRPQPAQEIERHAIYGKVGSPVSDLHLEAMQDRAEALAYTVRPHVHPGMLQLLFATGGVCKATIDGSIHTLVAPCLASIPGGVGHCFNFGPDAAGWILTVAHDHVLDAPLVRNEDSVTALLRQPHLVGLADYPRQAALLATLFSQLDEELRTEQRGRRAGVEYLLRLILLHYWRAVETRDEARHDDGDRRLFYDFRALLEQNLTLQWTVPEYARRLKCTPLRLNRVCRAFTRQTANAVILARLGEEARRLLVFTTAPAAHIGARLGFQEPSYFTRFFRRQTGMTPGAFRERQ